MRQEKFKMERQGLINVGDEIEISEYQSFMNYSYIIEPAVAMSGCYPNAERIRSRKGIVKNIEHTPRGFIDHLDIEKIGPAFENHVAFPDRVNTEFVEVIDEHTVKMRVWERGSGETLACGTGACAVAVASVLNGHVDGDSPVTVKLLGGDLQIFWNRQENLVYMTGPAATVFDGEIDVSFLK